MCFFIRLSDIHFPAYIDTFWNGKKYCHYKRGVRCHSNIFSMRRFFLGQKTVTIDILCHCEWGGLYWRERFILYREAEGCRIWKLNAIWTQFLRSQGCVVVWHFCFGSAIQFERRIITSRAQMPTNTSLPPTAATTARPPLYVKFELSHTRLTISLPFHLGLEKCHVD